MQQHEVTIIPPPPKMSLDAAAVASVVNRLPGLGLPVTVFAAIGKEIKDPAERAKWFSMLGKV